MCSVEIFSINIGLWYWSFYWNLQRLREQKESGFDAERLASARKRLQANYKEAENAKKQRTIQVMDIHEIPKPKNAFFGKNKAGGSQGKHWWYEWQTSQKQQYKREKLFAGTGKSETPFFLQKLFLGPINDNIFLIFLPYWGPKNPKTLI